MSHDGTIVVTGSDDKTVKKNCFGIPRPFYSLLPLLFPRSLSPPHSFFFFLLPG